MTIEIEIGNDAILTREDAINLVKIVVPKLKSHEDEGNVKDLNGNTVGWYEIK